MTSRSGVALVLLYALSGSVAWSAPVESFKLYGADTVAHDEFGYSVSISGTKVIVGAIGGDTNGVNTGTAYLFDAQTGTQTFKLAANDTVGGDVFGGSVAVCDSFAVVGALGRDDAGNASGTAYVFDPNTGLQLRKLSALDASAEDRFGHSVAVSGNLAIIGAYNDDHSGSSSGSAYVFDLITGNQLYKLTATDAAADDYFGWQVAIDGNTAIVGAHGDDVLGSDTGSVYVFDLTTGNQIYKLTASDAYAGDWFGRAVSISGNMAVVGARNDDDNGGISSGSAYVFDLTTGQQLLKLTASDAELFNHFGSSVAVTGNIAIIGAPQQSEGGSNSGAAYVFDLTTGQELAKIKASDAAADDWFGYSVGLSGATAVIGARLNFDQGPFAGTAYLYYDIPEPASGLLLLAVLPLLQASKGRVRSG